jgi:transcriptional regulator with GAF, ATPase, and Fis domain
VAHAIHRIGPRRERPFVQLNCAALNDALLESELFGHTRGAFTGAYRHRTGRFEAADGGDIFLDEIGDVPLPVQVKLLRVLETGQFDRVGDHRPVRVDVRIISATNKNLPEMVTRKQFREDLFFRINVIPIHLPPLRERREDIPILVNRFIQNLRKDTGKPITALAPDVLRLFMDYGWPGNVRQLKSTLAYAFVIADAGQVKREHLPPQFTPGFGGAGGGLGEGRVAGEKAALLEALRQTGGNQTQAARLLGINRVTVWHRMRKYGIDLKGDLKRGRFTG